MRKLVVYISMSLDGFLAGKDDDLSFLDAMSVEGEDYGYYDFTAGVDTYLVGRRTYEVVKGLVGHFPQAKQYNCYVITSQERAPEDGVTFYNGDLKELIEKLKSEPGKNIYCDGGGQLVQSLMKENLIDEYRVSVVPTILGDGKRLFLGGTPPIGIELVDSQQYSTGLVQLHYARK